MSPLTQAPLFRKKAYIIGFQEKRQFFRRKWVKIAENSDPACELARSEFQIDSGTGLWLPCGIAALNL
jgi:hypothetical protein